MSNPNWLKDLFIDEAKGSLNGRGNGSGGSGGNLTKLSQLENDLFYTNATEVLTITKDDFIPFHPVDEDGNPSEDPVFCYYKITPALDWFTSPDKIGFATREVDGDESYACCYNVTLPNNNDSWESVDPYIDVGYVNDEASMPYIDFNDGGIHIVSGLNAISPEGLIPEDASYITAYEFWFDSITIYKVDSNKIPENLYDHSEIDARIGFLESDLNHIYNYAGDTYNLAYTANSTLVTIKDLPYPFISSGAVRMCIADDFFIGLTSVNGNLIRSEDGITWTKNELEVSYPYCIAYGKGRFVAMSAKGNQLLPYYSNDCETWTAGDPINYQGTSNTQIIYINGKFICHSNMLFSSEDGITWEIYNRYGNPGSCLAYGNGNIVYGGSEELYCLPFKQTDYSPTDSPYSYYNKGYESVAICYADNKFIVVSRPDPYSRPYSPNIYCSEDGITWTLTASNVGSFGSNNVTLVYGNGAFLMTCTESKKYYRSIDGIEWVEMDIPDTIDSVTMLTYGQNKFIMAYGYYSKESPEALAYSEDGINWVTTRKRLVIADDDVTDIVSDILGVVPSPVTAEVGQVISVKSVDVNGKPTEWETVDMSEQSYIMASSTEGSTKRFKISVDDSGTLAATEIVE